jgi:SH3 and cysteine-rich domain-containing protein 2
MLNHFVTKTFSMFVWFRPACPSSVFQAWETLLQEVEIDSQAHSDIASILGRQVSRPLLERSFYRKIQSRKVFTHRESYDTILKKTEEMLAKVNCK